MLNKNYLFFLFGILFIFPGCIKYYKLSNMEFHQGKNHPEDRDALDGTKKRVAIYDEFRTKAIFDVLYLSDAVRMAYLDINSEKKGYDLNTKNNLKSKELEQNKFWTTFYILADIRDKKKTSLTDKNSDWSFYLLLDDLTRVQPISIKEIEVEPEYQYLFGSRFNLFQRYYEVKFPAKDLSGNYYINIKESFDLVLSSASKETHVKFNEPKDLIAKKKDNRTNKGKIVSDEDYYWI